MWAPGTVPGWSQGELRPWEAVPGRALQVAEVVEATFLVRGGPKLVVQMMVPVATS